jgi:hypothetical protein
VCGMDFAYNPNLNLSFFAMQHESHISQTGIRVWNVFEPRSRESEVGFFRESGFLAVLL